MIPLEERIKRRARDLGFELVGIADAAESETFCAYLDWLDRDYAGEMDYLRKHAQARRHPQSVLQDVRSVIMLGINYKPQEPKCPPPAVGASPPLTGKVARYARGRDYHIVLWKKLDDLLQWLQQESPACRGRGVVDTAPLLERDFARRAGLGWFGKNTMLLNKEIGSYFFLAALLVNIPLRPDAPHTTDHCGSCTACLDACPTDAFPEPGVLDSRRCISYLTIELKGPIAEELCEAMGDWLFGCDICQEVCPWNGKAPAGAEPSLQPRGELTNVDLLELFRLSKDAFRRQCQGSALPRPKRAGLLRNAAIVLGNLGDSAALPVLENAAAEEEPPVRQAAQWAIDKIHLRN